MRGDLRFYFPTGGRCEDCDLRNALNEMGSARVDPWTGSRLTFGCEGCGGSGVQSRLCVIPRYQAEALLSEKQLFVLELRLGDSPYTQRSIARMMGVSQQAVDKLERAGMAKLRGVVRKVVAL